MLDVMLTQTPGVWWKNRPPPRKQRHYYPTETVGTGAIVGLTHPLSSARQRPFRDTASPTFTGGGAIAGVYVLTRSCLINCLRTQSSTQVCLRGSWPAPLRRRQSHSLLYMVRKSCCFSSLLIKRCSLTPQASIMKKKIKLSLTQNDGQNLRFIVRWKKEVK